MEGVAAPNAHRARVRPSRRIDLAPLTRLGVARRANDCDGTPVQVPIAGNRLALRVGQQMQPAAIFRHQRFPPTALNVLRSIDDSSRFMTRGVGQSSAPAPFTPSMPA